VVEPFLLFGVTDAYDAVRIISARSLRSLPNRISQDTDALAPREERFRALDAAFNDIEENLRLDPHPEVLIDGNGAFDFSRARRLLGQRDQRPVEIRE